MDVLLCQEEVYSNPEKSKDVSLQKASLEEKLSALYEEWELSLIHILFSYFQIVSYKYILNMPQLHMPYDFLKIPLSSY